MIDLYEGWVGITMVAGYLFCQVFYNGEMLLQVIMMHIYYIVCEE